MPITPLRASGAIKTGWPRVPKASPRAIQKSENRNELFSEDLLSCIVHKIPQYLRFGKIEEVYLLQHLCHFQSPEPTQDVGEIQVTTKLLRDLAKIETVPILLSLSPSPLRLWFRHCETFVTEGAKPGTVTTTLRWGGRGSHLSRQGRTR